MEKTMTVSEFYDENYDLYGTEDDILNLEYVNMFLNERESKAFLLLTKDKEICLSKDINDKTVQVDCFPFLSLTYNAETLMSEVFEELLDAFYCLNRCEANHKLIKDYLINKIDMKTISIKDFFEKYHINSFIPEVFAYMFLDKREAEAFCALLGDNKFTLRASDNDISIDVKNVDEYIFAPESTMSEVFKKILSDNINNNTAISRIIKEYLKKI